MVAEVFAYGRSICVGKRMRFHTSTPEAIRGNTVHKKPAGEEEVEEIGKYYVGVTPASHSLHSMID
jgi:hypothetical protein